MLTYSRRRWWSGDYLDGSLYEQPLAGQQLIGRKLRELLGSFWQFFYKDQRGQVLGWLSSLGSIMQWQAQSRRQALLSFASRYRCPPARQIRCWPLPVPLSAVSREPYRYSGRDLVYGRSGLVYRNDSQDGYFSVPLPSGCCYVGMITNSLQSPAEVTWLEGQDFIMDNHPRPRLLLRFDPRLREWGFPQRSGGSEPVILLYLWNVAVENRILSEHWGQLLEIRQARMSRSYGEMLQAVLDGWAGGSSEEVILRLLSALTGVPLARTDERVVALSQDASAKLVITDKSVYRLPLLSNILVQEHDQLKQADILCDVIRLWNLNHGTMPADILEGIHFSAGFLRNPQYGGVFFPNRETDIQWIRQGGRWRAVWQLEGEQRAIEQFWSDVRRQEDRLGVTLAQLIAGRQDADDLPRQMLPARINPCRWIVENLLRFHLILVSVNLGALRLPWPWDGNLPALSGPDVWSLVRNLVPPWESVLLIFTLSSYDTITADLQTSEQYDLQDGCSAGDTVDADGIQEHVSISYTDDECHDD